MEKPILFNDEMVRAILEGRKTVTRRVVKGIPAGLTEGDIGTIWREDGTKTCYGVGKMPCQVGDILWIRETWNNWTTESCSCYECCGCNHGDYIYKASGEWDEEQKWKPSIHMPRTAARIFLKVTDVRVERIRTTTAGDCKKEGIKLDYEITDIWKADSYIDEFKKLWDSIYSSQGYGWEQNPLVWVIEFEKIKKDYVEIDKEFYADKIKQVGLDIKAVDGVYINENEMVITGTPNEDDENHNCDEFGCSSVSHVLYRQSI